jgi:hypothetical protein
VRAGRDAEHAVEGVNTNLAIGPVMHRFATQPVSRFGSAEHALDNRLLPRVARHPLFGAPVHAVGKQNGPTQALIQQRGKSCGIEVKLQVPAAGMFFELIANQFGQERHPR